MFRKILSILLTVALVNITGPGRGWAESKAEKEARFAEKVKAEVAKLNRRENAGVTVKLRDKTELRGYISQMGEDSFSITDSKSGRTTTVAYGDVTELKGLSKGAKIAIWVGVGVGVAILVGLVLFALGVGCGPGKEC